LPKQCFYQRWRHRYLLGFPTFLSFLLPPTGNSQQSMCTGARHYPKCTDTFIKSILKLRKLECKEFTRITLDPFHFHCHQTGGPWVGTGGPWVVGSKWVGGSPEAESTRDHGTLTCLWKGTGVGLNLSPASSLSTLYLGLIFLKENQKTYQNKNWSILLVLVGRDRAQNGMSWGTQAKVEVAYFSSQGSQLFTS
jgi:hypothetical protein